MSEYLQELQNTSDNQTQSHYKTLGLVWINLFELTYGHIETILTRHKPFSAYFNKFSRIVILGILQNNL
jgi:hypothetical protein